MSALHHKDGTVLITAIRHSIEQERYHHGYIYHSLKLVAGAALVIYALASTLVPSIFFHGFELLGNTEGHSKPVGRYDTSYKRAVGKSDVLQHLNPRASLSIREMDMTRSNGTREGQPVIAINPLDPDNLVYVSTRFYPLPSLSPVGGCFLSYSTDRGRTWYNVTAEYPLGTAPMCGEPQVFTDANGTFYLLNNQVFVSLEDNMASHPQLSKSVDGGKTWSAPSVTPLYMQGATKLRVDQATGKVYANGASSWEYPAAVSVSSDGGETWAAFNQIPGPIDVCLDYEIPDLPPVCGFPGRSIAVHDGILASAAEGLSGHPEMYVSRDDGVTWTTFPLTDSCGNLVANGTGAMLPISGVGLPSDPTPWVSADPTQTGRFALMVPRNFTLEIYVTEDAGEHFTGPAVIQTPDAQRPAVDFGSTGLLGVMWRTNSSGILDVYSTVSFDSGRTFAPPLKVTHRSEPVGQNGQPGDRASFIALNGEYAYVAWSDGRDGLLDGILAEVPIELYRT
ncbi:Sialidase [Xylariales sp. PMI_506]|nr:Sialidase [Xylariales sp. PMI_506]